MPQRTEEEKRNQLLMLAGAVIIVISLWIIGATLMSRSSDSEAIDSFSECAAAGNPVIESYPRQCRTPDGQLFVESANQPIIPITE